MGIYYYAVDIGAKQFFTAPGSFSIQANGIFHPNNPFPGMVVMKNIYGYHFEIWDDCGNDVPPDDDFKEVTEDVYEEYCKKWPEARKGINDH